MLFYVTKDEADPTQKRLPIKMVDLTDGYTPEPGIVATMAVFVSKAGGAWAAGAGTLTEVATGAAANSLGSYTYTPTAGELDTVGPLEYYVTGTGARPFPGVAWVLPVDFYDVVRAGLTALPNALVNAPNGLFTRGAGSGQINQNAFGQIDARMVGASAGAIQPGVLAAGAVGVGVIATGAIDAGVLTQAARTEIMEANRVFQFVDNIVQDPTTKQALSGRIRFFASKVACDAATIGGTGEGEIDTIVWTSTVANGALTSHRVSK